MPAAVVDANVLIATRLSRDQYHRTGREIAEGIDDGRLPTGLVPHDVLTEVLNFLGRRSSHDTAVETLDAVVESKGLRLVPRTRSDFEAARPLFRRYEELSFTDAIVVAYARRTDRTYLYSFDDDFDAIEGVTRLDVPVNPYR